MQKFRTVLQSRPLSKNITVSRKVGYSNTPY